jgi:hypothetical protein
MTLAKIQKDKIKNFPVPDSIAVEPFESIVELYYQTQGYITSSNKWFKLQKKGKRPGSSDIDVLAISKDETLIVSVTVNLDDKIRCRRNGNIREDMKRNLCDHFEHVMKYLKNVSQYSWLVGNSRQIRKILAYQCGYKKGGKNERMVNEALLNCSIKPLYSDKITTDLIKYVRKTQQQFHGQNLKTNNSLVMLVRLVLLHLKNKAKNGKELKNE